jgi:hypothetical protein
MDLADLPQLQRTLEGDRVVNAPAQEDHVLGISKQMRQLFTATVMVLHQGPQPRSQLLKLLGAMAGGATTAALGKGQRRAIESEQLLKECLLGKLWKTQPVCAKINL